MKRCTPLAHPATVVFAVLLLASWARPLTVQAQIVVVPPFEVTSMTDVATSAVDVATDGTMLFVWYRLGDGGGIETYARRYSAAGVALGAATRLDPTSAQSSFRFASDLRGGYVATWLHQNGPFNYDLFGFALDAAGARIGGDYQVNQFSSRPFEGSVAGLPSGSVFVWTQARTLVVNDVMARVHDASGVPRGDAFRVGSGEIGTHLVAGRFDGGFHVVWSDDGLRPVLRVYDAAGNPRASQAALDPLTWVRGTKASPIDDRGVLAGIGTDFVWVARVSGTDPTVDRQNGERVSVPRDADVQYASDGSVMFGWVYTDGDTRRVRGRAYDAELDPLADAFEIAASPSAQNIALARGGDAGTVVATWATASKVFGTVVRLCAPRNAFCGNGTVDAACGELCDDGSANDDAAPNACRNDCHPARCGDGVVDNGEECDDGNVRNCDGCSAVCTVEAGLGCGDGVPYPTCGESCDDGNSVAGDGCDAHCVAERALGGGSPGPDCFAEWASSNTANDPRVDRRGFIANKQSCVDNDPRCDFDGGLPGTCTFHVAVCVNNTNDGECSPPTRLAEWRLVHPSAAQAAHDPVWAADRAALAGVPGSLVGPSTRNLCTGFASVAVPIRGKQGKLKLKSVARGYFTGTDTDSLALTCLSSAP